MIAFIIKVSAFVALCFAGLWLADQVALTSRAAASIIVFCAVFYALWCAIGAFQRLVERDQ